MSQQIGAPLSSLPQEKKRSGEGKGGRNRIGQKGKPSLARQFAKVPSSRLEIVAHLKGASFFSHFYLLCLVQFSRFLLLGPWGVSSSRRGMVMDLPSQASQDAAAIRYGTRQWLNSQGQNMTNYCTYPAFQGPPGFHREGGQARGRPISAFPLLRRRREDDGWRPPRDLEVVEVSPSTYYCSLAYFFAYVRARLGGGNGNTRCESFLRGFCPTAESKVGHDMH